MTQPFKKLIVIGSSVGGLRALRVILNALPTDLPAPILVVHHTSTGTVLPALLSPSSALPVKFARDGEVINPGAVYIAPPNRHLLVREGKVALTETAKENFMRPAIDPLFRSAATAYRDKVIGVILTGTLDDGTAGIQCVKAYGGTAVVQDPGTAEAGGMPRSALEYAQVDYCLPLEKIGSALVELATEDRVAEVTPLPTAELENHMTLTGAVGLEQLSTIGELSPFTCPSCNGGLWKIKDSIPERYRCHTGHSFTLKVLSRAQDTSTEDALWAAIRALHEKATLMKRLAKTSSRPETVEEFHSAATQAQDQSEILQEVVRQLVKKDDLAGPFEEGSDEMVDYL